MQSPRSPLLQSTDRDPKVMTRFHISDKFSKVYYLKRFIPFCDCQFLFRISQKNLIENMSFLLI